MNPLQSILDHARPAPAPHGPLAALPVVAVPPAPAPATPPAFQVLAVLEPPSADGRPGLVHFAPGLSIQERSRINWEGAWAAPGGWSDRARAEAARWATPAPVRPLPSPSSPGR